MADKDERGRTGEQRAVEHLTAHGYRILDRNWRCSQGELDIVAAREGDLVAVEVKTRRSDRFGHPFEAVDARKRARLWRLACAWTAANPALSHGLRLRIDVIGITGRDPREARLEHLEDV